MSDIEIYKRKLERETKARKELEVIVENKTRELYQSNEQLKQFNENLHRCIEMRTVELREALTHLNVIIDNIADGLLVTDEQGNVTHFNPAFNKMFAIENDVYGIDVHELNPVLAELADKSLQDNTQPFHSELALAHNKTGKAIAHAFSADIENSALKGMVMLIRDITMEKEVDQMKTDFIATVSHELRTPLTSVLGFAKIIKKKLDDTIFPQIISASAGDKKIQRAVTQIDGNIDIIVSEGERLTNLINDVLDLSKMEAGKIDWNMEELSIEDIIDRAIAATSALFSQQAGKVGMIKKISPQLPKISGDKDRLIQVVINLISNSVKFTEEGSVTCQVDCNEDNLVIVRIIDTGIGIAPQHLDKVFDKFKQVGDTLTNKPKGTGLGLSICKHIIDHHGGKIWVESELGTGSQFCFVIPAMTSLLNKDKYQRFTMDKLVSQLTAHQQSYAAEQSSDSVSRQKTILVVDDEEHILELLRQELEEVGYRVLQAKDGMDAIMIAKEQHPDLITLDVMMPKINGFDTAAVLKNDPETMHIPIIILSIVADTERGYKLGVDRYLTKPINVERLLEEVNSLISQGVSKKKVMVVDENRTASQTLVEVLQAQGYHVDDVCNGEECIEQALKLNPDMIIVDALVSERLNIMNTLRFEKGLENILFILLGDENKPTE